MKGFKNSTKTHYSMGGDVAAYAKGGSVKGAAKISKVMGEFKKGELHSGSKEGPVVKNPKQAVAIAMSEARKAGMKAPVKKAGGGMMPPIGESVKSGNRMAEMEAKEERFMARRAPGMGSKTEREMREMKKRVPATRREPMLPPVGESVRSGNRISTQEAAEMRAMGLKKGGLAAMPKKGKC